MLRLFKQIVEAVKEGVVDFESQQFIQNFLFYICAIGTVFGFIFGFLTESFANSCLCLGMAGSVAVIVCIPSWPIYKLNQIKWTPHDPERISQLYAADGSPSQLPPQNAKAVAPATGSGKKKRGGDSRKNK